jgi:hypothetical protein
MPRGVFSLTSGYEKLREALKRQGKSDEKSKSMAAAIWNKHHKKNPVTNKPHRTDLCAIHPDQVLLGIPGIPGGQFQKKAWTDAEKLLAERLGRAVPHTQERVGLIAAPTKYRTSPNPNPNAPGPSLAGPNGILDYLAKKNAPSRPGMIRRGSPPVARRPRSQGGTGWFPERGDMF